MTLKKKVLALVMMAAASAMVACSKGSDNSSTASTPLQGLAGCVSGCPAGGVPLQVLSTRYGSELGFSLQLYGVPGASYNAQVGFGGQVNVQSNSGGGGFMIGYSCVVQNGTYSITTVQGGTQNANWIQGVKLHAQGINVQAAFDFTIGSAYMSGSSLSADVYMTSASAFNGYTCQGDNYWGVIQTTY